MKKTMLAVVVALLALGIFTGVASASTLPTTTGLLHEYMEAAVADKLGIPLAEVEVAFDAGTTLYQFALDNGIAEADLPAFMLEVRSAAVEAALADGVITDAQADRMLRARGLGLGLGGGMRLGGGVGSCGGTGVPLGSGMHRGGR